MNRKTRTPYYEWINREPIEPLTRAAQGRAWPADEVAAAKERVRRRRDKRLAAKTRRP